MKVDLILRKASRAISKDGVVIIKKAVFHVEHRLFSWADGQTRKMVEPVVLRASRSRWAWAASAKG